MNKKKITIIRKKLDTIDNQLLLILKKRVSLVNQVIQLKDNKKEIVDKKRINSILKRIKQKSKKLKIDPMISKNIWISMINSFIKYEFKHFKKK